jgi:hypothetical protein
VATSDGDDVNIDNVRTARLPGERPDLVRLLRTEGNDLAAAQEPSQLGLATGSADLGHDGSGGERGDPKLEPSPVLCPHPAI